MPQTIKKANEYFVCYSLAFFLLNTYIHTKSTKHHMTKLFIIQQTHIM